MLTNIPCPCCTQARPTAWVSTSAGPIPTSPTRFMCDQCAAYAHRLATCPHEVRR